MDGSDAKMLNCAMKTDLNLLLECLKYQMNCPDAQKQALHTIYSICQEKGEVIDYFREMGGVLFVYNLSKSSQHLEVMEAALFTLGGLAENNVFCQQALCRADIFTYMMHLLVEDSPLTLKRVVVYMVLVLVTNNRSGQTLATATGCIEVLLDLFRTSFPISTEDMRLANVAQLCQLWTSVSSALCGCVNNPQNEENQLICMTIFPEAKTWLERLALPRVEIMQPITSLIGMIVANNPSAQEGFASTGALQTLARALVRFAAESGRSPLARDLAVTVTKTLSACITDKAPLAAGLAEYHLVPQLLTLLSCPGLDLRNRLCIVLTLGHCTESCEEHQLQLLRAGGLPLIIQLLTQTQDEELRRAATFVLHTCKQMTSTLGTDGAKRSPQVHLHDPAAWAEPPGDVQSYRRSAWEMQARIEQLEKLQRESALGGVSEGERDGVNSSDKCRGPGRDETPPASRSSRTFWEGAGAVRRHAGRTEARTLERTPARPRTRPPSQEPHGDWGGPARPLTGSVRRQIFQASAAPQNPAAQQSAPSSRRGQRAFCMRQDVPPLDPSSHGASRGAAGGGPPPAALPESPVMFKRPYPAMERAGRCTRPACRDHMSLCSDVLESEIRRILRTPRAATKRASFRCSGCAPGLSVLNSRSFGRILRSCRHRCDRHAALLEAETRLKRRVGTEPGHRRRDRGAQISLTPLSKGSSLWPGSSEIWSKAGPAWITLTPIKKRQEPEEESAYHREGSTSEEHQEARRGGEHWEERASNRRKRKNFTQDEVQYLLNGVKRLGPCWNSILWSFPFQKAEPMWTWPRNSLACRRRCHK
ncbi:hypothetical protein COCON_G00102430 [Conger conger]|uniref:Telomere repeats-binding bouquet formation protein 1 n=1 Tax=Conger conger TaxID=82655 RepID=A0A9Q1DI15_CONCO|nr:hypothetical protein COCON_G00102430 [Conger conger]